MRHIRGRHSDPVLFTALHPSPPAPTPHGSIAVWVLVAVVLAVVIASGVVLTSRR